MDKNQNIKRKTINDSYRKQVIQIITSVRTGNIHDAACIKELSK